MKCKVKQGFVFHSKNEKGIPVIHRSGEIVEFTGSVIPAQLEAIKDVKKTQVHK